MKLEGKKLPFWAYKYSKKNSVLEVFRFSSLNEKPWGYKYQFDKFVKINLSGLFGVFHSNAINDFEKSTMKKLKDIDLLEDQYKKAILKTILK